ncbi:hypothetical protein RFM68_29800 [Mesorhizobium sp. MSK_1335]|uniref:Uncharacterized protein n=1 Tax=Mesorhizobium montanum TaxID=3072323 RepID=A0ABU4ZX98_9HYPH|nr:hypothetical protein [Mesorhizobium sp. MSK_1335]MDX8528673.1 hypothetical protein [Mesorhizobium sp. MSK_1335]
MNTGAFVAAATGRVKDFTEAAGSRLQFAARSATGLGRHHDAGQHQSVTRGLYLACNALAEGSRGLHDKFTASGNGCRPAFAFHRHFRQMCRDMPFSRPVRHGMVMEQQVSKQFSSEQIRTGNSP